MSRDVRLLIYGSRSWSPTLREIERVVCELLLPLGIGPDRVACVVSGQARGADTAGESWARACGFPIDPYPAAWRRADGSIDYGAGHRRNEIMARVATHAVGFRAEGKSNGTDDMTRLLLEHGTPHLTVMPRSLAHLLATPPAGASAPRSTSPIGSG